MSEEKKGNEEKKDGGGVFLGLVSFVLGIYLIYIALGFLI